MGCSKSSSKRDVYSNTILAQETRNMSNKQQITAEIKEEIKKYLQTNDNENTMTQNLWDATKAVLRRKFLATKSYLKN